MKRLMIIGVFVFLSGCATKGIISQPLNTNSGKPEITVCGINKTEAMEKFATGLLRSGTIIRRVGNSQIIVDDRLIGLKHDANKPLIRSPASVSVFMEQVM
ncbi:MAG: hypothetical protein ABSC55_13695 [Syntrophorhabdales bacterium]|jgi:hypothetical protein